MASPYFLPLFMLLTLTSLVSFSGADNPPLYDYTIVCDAKRYAKLGLQMSQFLFCNSSLSYYARAKNLVDSMNLAEKAKQLGNQATGVQRLGIPPYNWWSEALHGVANDTKNQQGTQFGGPVPAATSFPVPITTAAALNVSLWREIGKAVSTEARAMHNLKYAGLTFWSPNINLARDPRWGRTQETPGEDPLVVGLYAVNYVRGLQDVEGNQTNNDPNTRPLKVSACCKHYAAYDIDGWRTFGSGAVDRYHYNANVTERDMVESYLKPFEMCVKDGDVSSVMCSYNNINGLPACADAKLLKGTIRDKWNLHGYIVSDCDSLKTMFESQHFLDDTVHDAVAQAMRAGLDMDCGLFYPQFLEETVGNGLIKESDVDNALMNSYILLMRVGWFDGNPLYDSLKASDVCTQEHIELATIAAREGLVLLKNKGNALPLDPNKFKKIAVVGPHANATDAMKGNYAGNPCRYTPPIAGFKKYADVDYQPGCERVHCHYDTYIFNAMMAATTADATVIVVGLNLTYEAEDLDRSSLSLPGFQSQLIDQVAQASKGPVVLVILSSGTVNISSFISDSSAVDAIIWAGYPGQEGGQAIADVVYGAYNPSGRLPVTWYPSEYVLELPMTSQQFRPNDTIGYPGRTYRFYHGTTSFEFGHGLSYTQFTYSFVSSQKSVTKHLNYTKHCYNALPYDAKATVPACQSALISDLKCRNDITVQVSVKNVGKLDGSDAVMLYSVHPAGLIGAPIKHLVGFHKVFLKAGESTNVSFTLSACESLSFVTESAYEVLPQGDHKFIVGDQQMTFSVQLQK